MKYFVLKHRKLIVSDVTVNGIKHRCERSVSLMSMLSIFIWDVGGFISFEIKILYAFLFVRLLNSSFFLSFILISSVVATRLIRCLLYGFC